MLIVAPLALDGCEDKSEKALTLTDSEGRVFAAACTESDRCEVKQAEGAKWPGPETELRLHASGRIMGICNVPPGGAVESISDCRALVCEKDADCPPAQGLDQGSCLGEICTEPSRSLGPDDAVMLCLWGTGLGNSSTEQVERHAMGHNCGSPCEVPAPCHQP